MLGYSVHVLELQYGKGVILECIFFLLFSKVSLSLFQTAKYVRSIGISLIANPNAPREALLIKTKKVPNLASVHINFLVNPDPVSDHMFGESARKHIDLHELPMN